MRQVKRRRRFKTEEELRRMVCLIESLARMVAAEHAGEDWHGIQPCPVCGGQLALMHSGYNGHVWGFCGAAGCVRWME